MEKNCQIYIIAGKARQGKDTIAGIIKAYYEKQGKKVLDIDYAYYIKEFAKAITNWDGREETKPRAFLQELGPNFIRKEIDPNFFVKRICEDLLIYSHFFDIITISDARFPIEIEYPQQRFPHLKTIHVVRPNFLSTLTTAEQQHETEISLDHYQNYDYQISNDSTLEALKEKVETILKEEPYEH